MQIKPCDHKSKQCDKPSCPFMLITCCYSSIHWKSALGKCYVIHATVKRQVCMCVSVCAFVSLYQQRWLCSDLWGRSLFLGLCHSPKSSHHCEERSSRVTGGSEKLCEPDINSRGIQPLLKLKSKKTKKCKWDCPYSNLCEAGTWK